MSREEARNYYRRQPGEPERGYVDADDAMSAIDVIYRDLEAAVGGLVGASGAGQVAEAAAAAAVAAYAAVAEATFVNVAGDTMSGPLVLSADPQVALGAATKAYVDAALADMVGAQLTQAQVDAIAAAAANSALNAVAAGYLPLSGGTLSGALTVPAPTADGHAARRKYVDDAVATRLPLSGGTLTGDLTVRRPTAGVDTQTVVSIVGDGFAALRLDAKRNSTNVGAGGHINFRTDNTTRWLLNGTENRFTLHGANDAGVWFSPTARMVFDADRSTGRIVFHSAAASDGGVQLCGDSASASPDPDAPRLFGSVSAATVAFVGGTLIGPGKPTHDAAKGSLQLDCNGALWIKTDAGAGGWDKAVTATTDQNLTITKVTPIIALDPTNDSDAIVRWRIGGVSRWAWKTWAGDDRIDLARFSATGAYLNAPIRVQGNGTVLINGKVPARDAGPLPDTLRTAPSDDDSDDGLALDIHATAVALAAKIEQLEARIAALETA